MDAKTIKKLLDYLPKGVVVFGISSVDTNTKAGRLDHFAYCYSKPSFPWMYVQTLVKKNLEFPHHLLHWVNDKILYQAYLREKEGLEVEAIDSALILLSEKNRNVKAVINALLICDNVNTDYVSKKTGIDHETIEVYEKLFFNILDRKHEDAFLANVVYPNGRLVEVYKDYASLVDADSLLLRSGYNNGPNDVLYLGGFKQGRGHLETVSLEEAVTSLESIIMVNGYILARNGFLNQSSQSMPGMSSARNLIAASKQAGLDNGEGGSLFAPLSESIKQSLKESILPS